MDFLVPATTSEAVKPFGNEGVAIAPVLTLPVAFRPSPLGVFGVLSPKEPKAPPIPRLNAADADLVAFAVGDGSAGLPVLILCSLAKGFSYEGL